MSEIRATTISDAAGTGPITLTGQSASKAWANWTQISNTIVDSFNYSSYTDNGTGRSELSFTNSMANDVYCDVASGKDGSSNTTFHIYQLGFDGKTSSYHTFSSMLSSGSFYDSFLNTTIVQGELA